MQHSPEYDAEKFDESKAPPVVDHEAGYDVQEGGQKPLNRALKGRHMQMIAIGGAIGAGLFVGSGGASHNGGPGSSVICFMIIGLMLSVTVQALGELAVLYPVNGAFFTYTCRFIDESWGFAIGWDYAIGWLTILPFEITAAGITIDFWRSDINIGVWIAVFLTVLSVIQIFGVRGYGEVEFVLSVIKVIACTGFIISGVIIDCGGVPTDHRGYIGAHYWHQPGAFRNGFKGFCSVFVTASFAFGGTESTGLCAAEAANPRKSIPAATRQVFWRITFFYVVGLFIMGSIVPSDSDVSLNSSGANTKASPFVLAIELAGIKVSPSIFNAVITISVISVANSCTFGSTRTIQALALRGMAPKFMAYVDKHGRPSPCVISQSSFGSLAFVNEATAGTDFFNWSSALSGLANFFIWGSICSSHIRFRRGWMAQGHSSDESPYKAAFGVWGSYFGLVMNSSCLIAQFYVALFPIGGSPDALPFFQSYLAAFIISASYLGWKSWIRDWTFFIRAKDMDLLTGLRSNIDELAEEVEEKPRTSWKDWPRLAVRSLI